jgi:hypothetical protein
MAAQFNLSPWLLLVPLVVIVLAARRVPAIPALVIGALLGAATAVVTQPQLLSPEADQNPVTGAYMTLITTAYDGFTIVTGNEAVDSLLSRGGMMSMANTILLILMAMLFGGVMEASGMLQRLAETMLRSVSGAGSLVGATVGTCIMFNVIAAEQYLSIVVPGRMFREAYDKMGLDPRNLSRALEDGGTVTSVLVPWNTCGAFAAGVLGRVDVGVCAVLFLQLVVADHLRVHGVDGRGHHAKNGRSRRTGRGLIAWRRSRIHADADSTHRRPHRGRRAERLLSRRRVGRCRRRRGRAGDQQDWCAVCHARLYAGLAPSKSLQLLRMTPSSSI